MASEEIVLQAKELVDTVKKSDDTIYYVQQMLSDEERGVITVWRCYTIEVSMPEQIIITSQPTQAKDPVTSLLRIDDLIGNLLGFEVTEWGVIIKPPIDTSRDWIEYMGEMLSARGLYVRLVRL